MWQNIFLPSLKYEHPRPTYYLSPANIYSLVIHDDSNNICSVYTWTEFEGERGMKNISSCLLCWINDKGYYSPPHGKNNKTPEITILVENGCGQNKNNLTIRFLNMIKEGVIFGTATFNFYIKGHTTNDCDRAFISLQVLYRKQNVFTFYKCCEILNTSKNVEVI